jgi:DNA-binding PadR family transcriptional regulator
MNKKVSLGWFEIQILLLIYQRETYGYEILKELRHSGKPRLSNGLLYPTLRRLEKKGYIKTRRQAKEKAPDRIYYSITEEGVKTLEGLTSYLLTIIDRNMWDQLEEFRDLVIEKAGIEEGDSVLDLSNVVVELFALDLSKRVGESGIVYFKVDDDSLKEMFEKYFQANKINNIKPIIGQGSNINLRTDSMDLAVQIIGLHHNDDPKKLIEEMVRVVKPGKKVIISDMQTIDHIIFNNIAKILPKYYREGTSKEELYHLLSDSQLRDIKIDEWHGMTIGEGIK